MEKLVEYFVLLTGGSFVWKHINKKAIGHYFFYLFIVFGIVSILAFSFSFIFYTVFFLMLFCFVFLIGISTFYSDRIRDFVLKNGSTIEDAKYTIFLLIYIGAFGTIMSAYILLGGGFVKI